MLRRKHLKALNSVLGVAAEFDENNPSTVKTHSLRQEELTRVPGKLLLLSVSTACLVSAPQFPSSWMWRSNLLFPPPAKPKSHGHRMDIACTSVDRCILGILGSMELKKVCTGDTAALPAVERSEALQTSHATSASSSVRC